jgi:large subunit ribosomal protein L21
MYAIVEIAGQQFKVKEGKKIFVHRLEAKAGETIQFDKVLLVEDDGNVTVGEPVVQDIIIEGTVIDDKARGDKVIVFKKKRKKGYRIKNGHRQNFTHIEVLHIGPRDAPRKERAKKVVPEAAKVTEPAGEKKAVEKKTTTAKKSTAKKTESKEKKSTAVKKEEKKPAVKKISAKKPSKSKK